MTPRLYLLLSVGIAILLSSCKPLPDREMEKEKLVSPIETHRSEPVAVRRSRIKTPNLEAQYPKGAHVCTNITVTPQMSVPNMIAELANQADLGLQMALKRDEPSGTTLTLKNRPIYEAINRLCESVGLRAVWEPGVLKVEPDEPYSKNYSVQFLNMARTSNHHVSIATDVFSQNNKGSVQTIDNGSNSVVQNEGENNFWQELEGNLKLILGEKSSYAIHRQAGMVTVSAKHADHQRFATYINELRCSVRSQVVIEAKIIEVILRDQFKSGINWKKLNRKGDFDIQMPFGTKAAAALEKVSTSDMVRFGIAGQSFEAIVNALDEFGVTHTLSSPRLTVMNNQTAILKVAKNQVYFRLRYDKRFNNQVNQENVAVSSDIQTVPIGLVLSVQPSIDLDTDEVILFLRPTISRLSSSVNDPAVSIALQQTSTSSEPSTVPVVEVREIDSVLRTKSGEIAILGGLMETRSNRDISETPILASIPGLGELLRARNDDTHIVELVILLRATITDQPEPDEVDERLSHNVQDPRSFYPAG